MSLPQHPALARALALSRELLAAAEQSNVGNIALLDAERLRLLKLLRRERHDLSAGDKLALQEVADLNDRTIGLMEHHRRIKQRAMETVAVGRRAVAAYATTRLQR